ncbi:acetyl-CoA synthetase-like protein [Hypoxylon sp. NC1633]|nr:acetyl-CoA synthetase-like protein [Hypoxylon sp. NC1633]
MPCQVRIYRSGTIEIPRDLNLTELLHKSAYPDLPESHLIAKDSLTNRSITIGELRDRAGRIANGLKTKLTPGGQARWAILVPNSVEFLELFHAILWTGGVVCPVNHALKAAEVGHGLAVSRPHFVISYGTTMPVVTEALEFAKEELCEQGVSWEKPHIITIISRAGGLPHLPDDFITAERLPIPHWPDTADRLASIHLSSGTTGKSKGVELTHHNFVSNCLQLLAHDRTQFSPTTRTATTFQGVPAVVRQLACSDVAARLDFSRARFVNVGGALPRRLRERLLSRAPWRLVQVYGMTEAAGYVAYQRASESPPDGTTGALLPNIEACLKKEGSADDVSEGEAGELWLRGPNITRGYAFDEEASKNAFPVAGWYNTGDVCTIDALGRVGVVGRTKDLLRYNGFQVSPAELEAHVNAHPDVVEGGVGAVWDESQMTELPATWVVLEGRFETREQKRRVLREVQEVVDGQVSGYKKLRGGVWEVEALPKNVTGKIRRKEMAAMRDGVCSLDGSSFKGKL